jgi:hypothetical protein
LQYKNVRPDYLKAIWGVINWKVCGFSMLEFGFVGALPRAAVLSVHDLMCAASLHYRTSPSG